MATDINANVTFTNNPFNYTHFEEQFVNNPNAKIIIDYGVSCQRTMNLCTQKGGISCVDKRVEDIRMATLNLQYGKGKIIMTGLTARLLAQNEQFMEFFGNDLLLKETCSKFQTCRLVSSLTLGSFGHVTYFLLRITIWHLLGIILDIRI